MIGAEQIGTFFAQYADDLEGDCPHANFLAERVLGSKQLANKGLAEQAHLGAAQNLALGERAASLKVLPVPGPEEIQRGSDQASRNPASVAVHDLAPGFDHRCRAQDLAAFALDRIGVIRRDDLALFADAPDPRCGAPGKTATVLAPILVTVTAIAFEAPRLISIMAMTAATPMITPSIVSIVRMTLRCKACNAIRVAPHATRRPLRVRRRGSAARGARSRVCGAQGRCVVSNAAVGNPDDAVCVSGHISVMGHQKHGDSLLLVETTKELQDFLSRAGVQVAGGFVRQKQDRIVDQRPSDRHALLLAAGQFRRRVIHPPSQADQIQQVPALLADSAARPFDGRIGRRHADVFERGGTGQQVEALKDEPDAAAAQLHNCVRDSRPTSTPLSRYEPCVGLSIQPRRFISVVLPEPDAPMSATNSPASIDNDTSVRTGTFTSPT